MWVFKGGNKIVTICDNDLNLEPQTTIKKWMFGDFQPFPM